MKRGRRFFLSSLVFVSSAFVFFAVGLPSARADEPALLEVGAAAPAFQVKAHDGTDVDLAKLHGKFVALYFYPRDNTGGCTKEACSFRDSWAALKAAGVQVLGVSTDGNESHEGFAKKFNLPFPLLPDEKSEIASKYHVPVVNNAARRITYLIDPSGHIAFVWPSVKPEGHAGEILDRVTALKAAAPAAKEPNTKHAPK